MLRGILIAGAALAGTLMAGSVANAATVCFTTAWPDNNGVYMSLQQVEMNYCIDTKDVVGVKMLSKAPDINQTQITLKNGVVFRLIQSTTYTKQCLKKGIRNCDELQAKYGKAMKRNLTVGTPEQLAALERANPKRKWLNPKYRAKNDGRLD